MATDGPLPIEVEMLALKALEKRVEVGLAATKAIAQSTYREGDSRKFRSPSGLKLGTVTMTDPNPQWVVTDKEAHERHLRSFPANLEEVAEIDDMDGAIAYLAEHAPRFLAFVSRVKPEARKAAMDAARAGDEVPGIGRVKAAGHLSATADKHEAVDAIAELVKAGRLSWDGRRVLEQKQEEAS